jgi:hypothetical protein
MSDRPSPIAAWATFYPNGSTESVYAGIRPPNAEPLYRHSQTPSDWEIDALEFVVEEGRIASMTDYGILRSWLVRLRPEWEGQPYAKTDENRTNFTTAGGTVMGDIVDQLRERSYGTKAKDPLCERAADEIESLREMVEKLSARAKALDHELHCKAMY